MRWLVIIVASLLAVALGAGFLGQLHPLGDSLAVFRLPLAGCLALLIIWTPWSAFLRWPLTVLCLAIMGQIVMLKYTSHPVGPVTIYQKNLLFQNDQVPALLADIQAAHPDIVALQELTSRNAGLVHALRPEYPYQASCALTDWARVAVLSRWPVDREICLENKGLIGVKVKSPDGDFWAFSLHAFWPWPHGQGDQMAQVIAVLASLDAPLVIAGDFNMVPWSFVLQTLEDVTDTTRAGPLFPTLHKLGMPLPIDHVFAPGGGRASARALAGSDHVGVLAEVTVFD